MSENETFEQKIARLEHNMNTIPGIATEAMAKVSATTESWIPKTEDLLKKLEIEGGKMLISEETLHPALPKHNYKLFDGVGFEGSFEESEKMREAITRPSVMGALVANSEAYISEINRQAPFIGEARDTLDKVYDELGSLVDLRLVKQGEDARHAVVYTERNGEVTVAKLCLHSDRRKGGPVVMHGYESEDALFAELAHDSEPADCDVYLATHVSELVLAKDITKYAAAKLQSEYDATVGREDPMGVIGGLLSVLRALNPVGLTVIEQMGLGLSENMGQFGDDEKVRMHERAISEQEYNLACPVCPTRPICENYAEAQALYETKH